MSLLIIFNNKDPKPWKAMLQQKLNDVEIEIYPEVKDPSKITFALCWKAEENALAQFPNLKVVQSVGASIDHITSKQNLLAQTSITRIVDAQLSEDMFEFVLTAVMNHLKGFSAYRKNAEQKIWAPKTYATISKTRIGIMGLGKIGSHVAEKFCHLGFQVSGWSRTEKDINGVKSFQGVDGLHELVTEVDVLINILPLTKETENILNLENLSHLKKGAYLINVGRGEHLDEEALLDLLDRDHICGALLDVFRKEPLPKEHPFWENEKITITPHVAALTNVASASDIVVHNYLNQDDKEKLLNLSS